ncbi:MAG TPA: hypothetical protein VHY19_03060, partial [Steroidobacteraceae bacterium]|nr:hypothetical protein [Steroidobacteraceae bacterium]
ALTILQLSFEAGALEPDFDACWPGGSAGAIYCDKLICYASRRGNSSARAIGLMTQFAWPPGGRPEILNIFS